MAYAFRTGRQPPAYRGWAALVSRTDPALRIVIDFIVVAVWVGFI